MVPPSSDTWFTFFFIFVHFPLIAAVGQSGKLQPPIVKRIWQCFFLSRYFFANVSLSVNCEESGLWNIFFADALDSWIVWQTFPPLIIQAGSFEASQLLPSSHLIILNLLITLILMDLIILIPSVRGGVKLHIDVYWQPTVSNKKWDLLLEKAGTEYLFQIQAKTLPHGWPKFLHPTASLLRSHSFFTPSPTRHTPLFLLFSPLMPVFFSTSSNVASQVAVAFCLPRPICYIWI